MGASRDASILRRMSLSLIEFLIISLLPVSALLTGVIRRSAVHLRLLDQPSARSAHHSPIPRGGGAAIVVVFGVYGACLYVTGAMTLTTALMLVGTAPVAMAGLIDDLRTLDFRWRIVVQLAAAYWIVCWLDEWPMLPMPGVAFDPGMLWWLLLPLALVWLGNLYNFMDGIDGLAATQGCFVLLASLALQWQTAGIANLLAAGLLASTAGFLVWNLPPARIFLGDVGSTWLGFALGVLALLAITDGTLSVWSWLLLMGVFIVDATVTLLARMLRGCRWHEAHSSHAYQHLARRWASHGRVVAAIMAINLLWLLPLAWLAQSFPEYGVLPALSGIVPLICLAIRLGAGNNKL